MRVGGNAVDPGGPARLLSVPPAEPMTTDAKTEETLLKVDHLSVHFELGEEQVRAHREGAIGSVAE